MSVSIETRQAYSEIDEFLGLLTEEQRNEIPKKLSKAITAKVSSFKFWSFIGILVSIFLRKKKITS